MHLKVVQTRGTELPWAAWELGNQCKPEWTHPGSWVSRCLDIPGLSFKKKIFEGQHIKVVRALLGGKRGRRDKLTAMAAKPLW